MKSCDLIVIGAGPAGMSAATLAAAQGASVTVLDEQPTAGGQIYRNIANASPDQSRILGPDYLAGKPLRDAFTHQIDTHLKDATVWDVSHDGQVTYSIAGTANVIRGKYVLIATGALERAMPITGWTLPGVMTAGAAQIMIKTSGLLAQNAVLVGAGPLLYLVATQMIDAGTTPLAIVETPAVGGMTRAAGHLAGAARGWRAIAKGLGLLHRIRRAGVRRYTAETAPEILGDDQVSTIRFCANGQTHELSCSTVLLHLGVVPNTQITRSLRLDHIWNDAQRCFHPVCDDRGRTSNDRIYVAGDGGGIGGAKAAEYAGRISASDVLLKLGKTDQAAHEAEIRDSGRKLHRERAVRPFLDALYAPSPDILRPKDDVIICRCEEVRAGEIRDHAKLGCSGPNQTKAFSRCGMGPCQGRYCGLTVTEILAQEIQRTPDFVGAYRIRSPLKPVTLAEVASLAAAKPTANTKEDK